MIIEVLSFICLVALVAIVQYESILRLVRPSNVFKVWKGLALWLTGAILVGFFALAGFAWGSLKGHSVMSRDGHLLSNISEDELWKRFFYDALSEAQKGHHQTILTTSPIVVRLANDKLKQWKGKHYSCCEWRLRAAEKLDRRRDAWVDVFGYGYRAEPYKTTSDQLLAE